MKLLEGSKVVKALDLVVRNPKLLEGGGNVFKVLNSLNIVAAKRQNFKVLKTLHRHNLDDGVRRQRQLLAVLELVDLIIKFLEGVGQLTDKVNLSGFLGGDSSLLLPPADSFSQGNSRHFRLCFMLNLNNNYTVLRFEIHN